VSDLFEALKPDPSRAYRPVAPKEALSLSNSILQTHPDDPFAQLLRLRVLFLTEETETLRSALDDWQEPLAGSSPSLPDAGVRWIRARLAQHDLPEAQDAAVLFRQLVASDDVLDAKLARLPELLNLSEYGAIPYWPRIWDCQVFARSVRSATASPLLEAGNDRDLLRLRALCHIGRLMERNGTKAERLVGRGVEMIGLGGIEELVLHESRTSASLRQIASHLDLFVEDEDRASVERWAFQDSPALALAIGSERSMDEMAPQVKLEETYSRQASAFFRLIGAATAAREFQMATGDLPASMDDLKTLLGERTVSDPFGSGPLGMARDREAVRFYSIGPNQSDERADLLYDGTNGTTSAGDIWIEIPAPR